ncbi:MAG: sigma-70 family RNA polymerase sigma factor [Anaerolineae bacterium]|nr:sigma-70 family RNA polymerase sigma factor [Anaerolineae bacterium]
MHIQENRIKSRVPVLDRVEETDNAMDDDANNLIGEGEANEQIWVRQAQRGDRQAFGELVRQHRAGVIQVIYRMCGDANLAEDAAQETFIRAWQYLHKYQPRAPFRNWLYRIATNSAVNLLRREREMVDVEDLPLTSPEMGPEATAEAQERAERVRQAVLALPEASRSVLVLREYSGFAYQDIADTLEIPIGTVMSRLNYARKRLRELLMPYLEVQ